MTFTFGDIEPEDSWDPDDPVPELVDNLIRRVALLAATGDRDRLRIRQLADDLAHIRDRVD